jgi:hypothetical protein
MAEQHGKPRIAKVLTTPVPGKGGAQPKRKPNRGTASEWYPFAGAQTPTISLFLRGLSQLPKSGRSSGSSAETGGNSGSSSKK